MVSIEHTTVIDNVPMGVYNTGESKNKELPSCNNCIHNGSWTCIKCSGFDHYEKAR